MGRFRSKLKGQTKGKRWPKGQSSSSNPECQKYRNQAKSRFFQENLGPSGLTMDSLKKHDAIQLYDTTVPKTTEMETEYSESSLGSQCSYNTMQSFASEWSECSNMSFNKFMKTFHVDSALHKQMLAILAAITEVIKQNGGSESSTEYFCSLLTTLETVYNSDQKNEEQITAVLALLNMGIKSVPEAVLRKNFNDVTLKMLLILKDFASADNNVIIKSTLGVLTTVLKVQELAMWSHDSIKQIFNAILNPFCIHSKPKWRKAAQNSVALIVKAPCFENRNAHNIPADKCAEFCEGILSGIGKVGSVQAGQTTILHVLGLLKETIQNFSKAHIKKSCENILRLMTLNYPIVTSCGLQVIHSLFSAQQAVVSSDLNTKLISALYEYMPGHTDVQPTLAWLLVMQEAHVHLADIDISVAMSLLPKFFSTVTQMWLSGKTEVISGATHCLEVLLKDAVGPACESENSVMQHYSKLEKCFNTIHLCLSYQYNSVWSQVLHILGIMFDVAGSTCPQMFMEILKSLAELRDSFKFSYNSELEYAVGAAIRSMGPEDVLNVIPLKKENGDLNIDRSWLLPVLKDNIKCSTLKYFRDGIFPLARYCQQRSAQLAQANDGIGAHSSELLYLQLWNLLPCFCNNPTDIKDEFKNLAKMLGLAISEKKELRLSVMASLRKLIQSAKDSENKDDISELGRYDKNYLPILFNAYTTKPIGTDEEGQRLASLETIKVYLTIARPELTSQLFTNAVERLNASSDEPEDHFIKESILDLIRCLIPYQNVNGINTIYEQCVKNLPEIKNNKEQKKAYRLLEEIVSCESEGCKNFVKSNKKSVQKLLMKSLNTAVTSSKGARLRCQNYLIKAQPKLDHESKLIRAVIPEAVLCCKDINEKCRETAYAVLNTIGEALMKHDQVDQYIIMLITGLAGTSQMVSCSILALASALHNFSGGLGQENIKLILDNVVTLSGSPTREIVGTCLSFIKVFCTSLSLVMVQHFLGSIMKVLTGMTDDCKRHYRIKVRDILDRLIRKYGIESIAPFIPSDDQVMQKRIKNLRKLNDRKKKLKKERKEMQDDEDFTVKSKPKTVEEILADSDSDLDDVEPERTVSKPKKQPKTWIEEDPESIIDFTDPTITSKISATKPAQVPNQLQIQKKPEKARNRGFKTAPDGRLIIKDADSSDSESSKKKSGKINFNSDTSDSEDESASVAETLLLSDRKRKRSGSVKSGMSFSSQPPSKYKAGGIGIHRPINSASSVKSGTSSSRTPGAEFKSKKAAGDVKRKGKKFDPYAYVPLQRTALNKRKKAKGIGQLKNIVKGAKSGALRGAKAKKNRKTSI